MDYLLDGYLIQLVEQMRDIWEGRESYTNDVDWLDNLEATIGEVVLAFDLEPISIEERQ